MHQYSLSLIPHEIDNAVITQRASDGYINATALCKAGGKLFANYVDNLETQQFLRELSSKTGIPIDGKNQGLIHSRPGAPETGGGTWVHPKVSIHLGQWVSAKFAVQVAEWVMDWMSGKTPAPVQPKSVLPPHLARYFENDPRVPLGYFSILQETGVQLYGPLHKLGFDIPREWVPDISVGKMFCAWLRKEKHIDTDTLPTYRHDYMDGRVVEPKLYPNEYLPDYRMWFGKVWLPEQGLKYFKKKDPDCLTFLDRMPVLAAPTRTALLGVHP